MTDNERAKDASAERQGESWAIDLRREIEIGVEQVKAGQLSDGRAFFEKLRQGIRGDSTMNEHDRVVLTRTLPSERLVPGDVGTVVHVYAAKQAYEIEFTTLDGRTAAVVTVGAAEVRPVRADEITHARTLN